MWLGSGVAVAVAGRGSDLLHSQGSSICRGCGPRRTKKKKKSVYALGHFDVQQKLTEHYRSTVIFLKI